MTPSHIEFTDNSLQDLADIYIFQTLDQQISAEIAANTTASIRKTCVFILSNLPNSGKSYGYQGTEEIQTIVALKKYMIFYHHNVTSNTVTILHIFCTRKDDKVLYEKLKGEGVSKHAWR